MKISIKPCTSLNGKASAPPSKSYSHRAIILASLAKGRSNLHNVLLSDDPKSTIRACKAIGAKIEIDDNSLVIDGTSGNPKPPTKTIDVGNSGTTMRIMTAVCSLCSQKVALTGDQSIKKRPMQPLLDALGELGAETSSTNGKPPVWVKGPMRGGSCSIPGDVSSQFISGLLISSPLSPSDTEINIIGELKSKPYVDLTIEGMKDFGVEIENKNYKKFLIRGNQKYKATDYIVEGDYSGAAFLLAAAALCRSDITIENLFKGSRQGDKNIVSFLKEMGADINIEGDRVHVRGGKRLEGTKIDLSQNPDLLPILAVVGALAEGETVLHNAEHVRFKECDRIKAMATELKKMGADIKEKKDGLVIKGKEKLKGAQLHGWHDHRIVMALAVAGLNAEGKTIIDTAESIPVSFPNFVEVMNELGADIS